MLKKKQKKVLKKRNITLIKSEDGFDYFGKKNLGNGENC